MAYVNVLDWDPTSVVEWLNGLELEPSVTKNYCESFRNNNINGKRLLHLTVSDLMKLNVEKLGHQEIILEGLEKLKNFVSISVCFRTRTRCFTSERSVPDNGRCSKATHHKRNTAMDDSIGGS